MASDEGGHVGGVGLLKLHKNMVSSNHQQLKRKQPNTTITKYNQRRKNMEQVKSSKTPKSKKHLQKKFVLASKLRNFSAFLKSPLVPLGAGERPRVRAM